ncbi:lantibiotic immunity ABC transporter MutG family permease subunit [Bacillus sp. z60-18]|uniref:lantibiotic immunity ABC transporter MutG family permease subunit n=1 Tax=unclassified Bacillus (in: firmicutes) TaxID=185979 RepID=UPI00240A7AB3|nr:lantibiotic immunity ABC transporter MutG family permease subunit [Bacillus sp. HSf4]WFA05504.1 lantibiotic immunity ABC transporter MutG family permease subunit [Bacillus sp. HSf4]
MLQFYRCLLGECKKRKRSIFLLSHLSIPLVLSGALVMYFLFRNVPVGAEASYLIFFELIGVGTPVIISIICGLVADSENEAGHFQNILGLIQSRTVSFISQTTMMIFFYTAALFLTISIYTLALKQLAGVDEVDLSLYYVTGMIFAGASIFQYFFYQVVGYNYGIGMCSICGFGGVIITALCLTTIGDKIWWLLPWAWANRFGEYVTEYLKIKDVKPVGNPTILMGGYSFLLMTTGIILLSIVWINRWSGRKTND